MGAPRPLLNRSSQRCRAPDWRCGSRPAQRMPWLLWGSCSTKLALLSPRRKSCPTCCTTSPCMTQKLRWRDPVCRLPKRASWRRPPRRRRRAACRPPLPTTCCGALQLMKQRSAFCIAKTANRADPLSQPGRVSGETTQPRVPRCNVTVASRVTPCVMPCVLRVAMCRRAGAARVPSSDLPAARGASGRQHRTRRTQRGGVQHAQARCVGRDRLGASGCHCVGGVLARRRHRRDCGAPACSRGGGACSGAQQHGSIPRGHARECCARAATTLGGGAASPCRRCGWGGARRQRAASATEAGSTAKGEHVK